jgi:hypothetical protein
MRNPAKPAHRKQKHEVRRTGRPRQVLHNPGEPDDPHVWFLVCAYLIDIATRTLDPRLGFPVATGISGFVILFFKVTSRMQVTTAIAALISTLTGLVLALTSYLAIALFAGGRL